MFIGAIASRTILSFLALGLAAACSDNYDLPVANQTRSTVRVFLNGEERVTLPGRHKVLLADVDRSEQLVEVELVDFQQRFSLVLPELPETATVFACVIISDTGVVNATPSSPECQVDSEDPVPL